MTAGVTSISNARARARTKAETRVANHRTATLLVAVVAILAVIGLGATLSASWVVDFDNGNAYSSFLKQAGWLGVGSIAMLVAARIPYQWYQRLAVPIFVVSIVGLVAVLAYGHEVSGAQRWLVLGPVRLQPSELAKFGTVVFLAAVLTKKEKLLGDFGHYAVPVGLSLGIVTLLTIKQPDFGTTLVIAAGAMVVIMASATPIRYVLATLGMGAIAAGALAVSQSYRLARITSFFAENPDILGDGYQLDQSLKALGTGGMVGIGLGESRARWLFLPNAHTDFIFSIIGEELGFIGAVFILFLFAGLSLLGMVVSLRAPDRFGRLLAAGITAWIVAQAIVNIGGVVGVLPISGIALPFVSYGGSALLMAMGSIGVLINVARQGRVGGMHPRR